MNAAMVAGTQELLANVLLSSPKGDVEELLTASYGFANADTAPLFGLPADKAPRTKALVRVELDPRQRAGVLTDPTVMASLAKAAQTAPVLRGLFVRERLLCQTIPPPPADVDNSPPAPDPRQTTRQQFAAHRASPACGACHALMDPIGFGLEGYDALGVYRTTENGLPVDASGELTQTRTADGAFVGGVELARRLARADEVTACLGRQWLRYALGRAEAPADTCTLARLRGGGGRVRDLLTGITTSPAFLTRPPVAPEKGACP
jgi:hypothetical protein